MAISNIFIFGLDLILFGYFTQIALNTTSITVRIVACFAMTAEVFFMREHIKIEKLLADKKQD